MELNEALYMTEGKFVKEINSKWVKPILKNFLFPQIDKERQRDPEIDDWSKTSKLKLEEYTEEFIRSVLSEGKYSHANLKDYSRTAVTKTSMSGLEGGTAVWTINIMKELHLDTNKPGNIMKFEKQLTSLVTKELKKDGIKLSLSKK